MSVRDRVLRQTSRADLLVRAPGRVNLVGEHTDYNDGWVLPMALEQATYVAGRREGDLVQLRSLDAPGEVRIDLASGDGPSSGWGSYVAGVLWSLREAGFRVHGLEGVVATELPVGAGLSSSAALEVAVAVAVLDDDVDPSTLAELCRRAENDYVGVRCGIMDQLAVVRGEEGHALLIDCGRAETVPVPIPPRFAFILADAGLRRSLGDGPYNERRRECERAAEALGVPTLRYATPDMVRSTDLPSTLRSRALHVVTENQRVRRVVDAMQAGDMESVGKSFVASHASLSRDFEVSTPQLDALVETALEVPGIAGARLTGAGFGGCTVNLVDASVAAHAARALRHRYQSKTGTRVRTWTSRPARGAAREVL